MSLCLSQSGCSCADDAASEAVHAPSKAVLIHLMPCTCLSRTSCTVVSLHHRACLHSSIRCACCFKLYAVVDRCDAWTGPSSHFCLAYVKMASAVSVLSTTWPVCARRRSSYERPGSHWDQSSRHGPRKQQHSVCKLACMKALWDERESTAHCPFPAVLL